MHRMAWALTLAAVSAGNNIAARMAMMAITTRSSISVKPRRCYGTGIRSGQSRLGRIPLSYSSGISDLLLEPVKLTGISDGIGHDILAVDDDR